jgi:hypothetical protein
MHDVSFSALSDHANQASESSDIETTVNVLAAGFALVPESSQAPPGKVTFAVRNAGTIPHNFAIEGSGVDLKTPVIQPGETAMLTVNLQPGSTHTNALCIFIRCSG